MVKAPEAYGAPARDVGNLYTRNAVMVKILDEGIGGMMAGQRWAKPGPFDARRGSRTPMKRLLLAALTGLLWICGTCGADAAQTPMAPSGPTGDPGGADSPTEHGVAAVVPDTAAAPLSYRDYLPRLQEFYARGEALYDKSRSNKLSDADIEMRFSAFIAWANEAGNWMNSNIGPAAMTKFTTWHAQFGKAHKLAGRHSNEANDKFQTLNVVLPQLLDNLRVLMTPGA